MSRVTIKGRVSTTALRRGEVVTVERTEAIDALVSRGYVEVVDSPQEAPSLTGVVTPPETDDRAAEAQPEGSTGHEEPKAPAKSASRADWVEFLATQGIEVGEDDTRDDLVDHWHLVDRG